MKKITRKIICACCGYKAEMDTLVSHGVKQVGLDGRPQYEWQLRHYQECPKCHYVSWDINKRTQEDITTTVSSDKYQSILTNIDDKSRYYEAMLLLTSVSEERLDIILQYLWWTEFNGDNRNTRVREMALSSLEEEVEKHPLVTYVFIYIDLLRRTSRFEKALNIINDISEFIEKNKDSYGLIYSVYQYECKLIMMQDSTSHFISEVVG